jgi:quinoprotein glucose dehydrogenase
MRSIVKLALVAPILGLAAFGAYAQSATDWPEYGRDPGGMRYSPMTQITPANVSQLKVAWTYGMNPQPVPGQPRGVVGGATSGRGRTPTSTATPIMVGGMLYLPTPYGRVVALNADTGKQVWAYALPTGDQPPFRGVTYWPGNADHAPRIIFGTIQGRLIALDARTGELVPGFGDKGSVNLKTPEIMNGFEKAGYGVTAPGVLYRNLIIMGSRVQEQPQLGPSGAVRAYDVVTGKLVWTFNGIAQPGDKNHATWEDEGWKQRSGVNVWNLMTVDAPRGIVYLPFSAPTIDRYGGDHLGSNLYSSSLVAVSAATGKYLWHFQMTHHDIWDLDAHTPPTFLTVRRGGRDIPAVAAINKSAYLFILNRVTGEPLYEVNEVAVPASTAPGEKAWPTQPKPVKPAQLSKGGFQMSEIADVTPALKAFCEDWIKRDNIKDSVMYEPIPFDRPMAQFPSAEGGPEWGGGAFDPKLGYYIVNTNSRGAIEQIVRQPNGGYSFRTSTFREPKSNMNCNAPPWGELAAVNVNTGDIVWRVNLGVTDSAPPGKQNTGRVSNGGPILTASGLTFIAGTDDARFRAFETATGKEIWTYKLDYSGHATPITYRGRNGKQYVVVIATGGSYLGSPAGGDSVMAFTLP